MPKRIFLSFLGTNAYVPCNYYPEGDEKRMVEDVKYVQEATIRLFCDDFTEDDLYCFFLTEKARNVNWNDNGWRNQETGEYNAPNEGLYTRLQEMGLPTSSIKTVDIPDGFSSDEIWEIFEKMFKELSEGDKVHFDITHAFRFIPMLGYSLLNYAKALKNVEVCGIYYGAFEKLGSAGEVNKMPVQERNAPVLNLLSLVELQSWTQAANAFVRYGYATEVKEITDKRIRPLLRQVDENEETIIARQLNLLSKSLGRMTDAFHTNRGKMIFEGKVFEDVKENLNNLSDRHFIEPLAPLLNRIEGKISIFSPKSDWKNSFRAVRWCVDHQLIPQAVTLLQESVVTYLCEKNSLNYASKNDRELVEASLFISGNKLQDDKDKWSEKAKRDEETVVRILEDLDRRLVKQYSKLKDKARNDVNHAGYLENSRSPTEIYQALLSSFSEISEILQIS